MFENTTKLQDALKSLFLVCFGTEAQLVESVPSHASLRKYFLLSSGEKHAVGVYGPTLSENQAFFHIQKELSGKGIPVPDILKVDDSGFYYLQSYHGPNDVFSYLENASNPLEVLKKSVEVLAKMHLETRNEFDFSLCYPHQRFDISEVKREFWSFEHKYLANKGITLKEEYFKQDIELVQSILELIPDEEFGFMHRDFQTRNLLVDEAGNITIIDFQGGREGPIYYDLAAIIYSPESRHAHQYQNELIDFYRELFGDKKDRDTFMKYFLVISLVRLLHTLGVHGVLGIEQNNEFFKKNITTAEEYLVEVLSRLKSDFNIEFKGLGSLYNSSV